MENAPASLNTRQYETADLDACLAVFDSNVPTAFLPHEREDFEGYLLASADPYYVVACGDEIVACGGTAVEDNGATGVLCWGIVRKDRHRQGIGEYFVRWRIARLALVPSIAAIRIETIEQNLGFFQRLGFLTFEHTPDFYAPGWDRYRMRYQVKR
jgi:hypothetical protein